MGNCGINKISSAHRSNLHKILKDITVKNLQTATATSTTCTLQSGEPAVEMYLEPKDENDANYRSDIAIDCSREGEGHKLMDITTTCPFIPQMRQKVANGQYKAGDGGKHGQERKRTHYGKYFHLDRPRVPHEVQMQTICFETTGPIDEETEGALRQLALIMAEGAQRKENNNNGDEQYTPTTQAEIATQLRYLKQQYSVSLQGWRARWMRKFRTCYTLPERPPIPQQPGCQRLPILAPPLYIGLPHNNRRTNAVTPLPPRAPPGVYRRSPTIQ